VLGDDVLTGAKVLTADYDTESGHIIVTTGVPVEGDAKEAFLLTTSGAEVPLKRVIVNDNVYELITVEDLTSMEAKAKTYSVVFDGYEYGVRMPSSYSSDEFEEQYTYEGNDLGATWTSEKTNFKVWAPTADDVKVKLYASGTEGTNDCIDILDMTKGDKGVWSAEKTGDLNGIYYTYSVTMGNSTKEACDPYAVTTGVNGNRAMVLNLDATNPENWTEDCGTKGKNYTDAVIYEMHVRDFSIDASSGISDKGKFLGLTETGTKTITGQTTGLDYLIDLGVTHLHLLPSYDYATVDETQLDKPQYNWGYDPKNYNVPEGSYSTDPYNGEVRVKEMKQMVKTLHDNNINVIMDVVYNHVYSADDFCFNQIVPQYFSRTNEDGSYSNGSGCGNDTASERSMVKKYIVDSVNYWADEYHIDGFRFDLVGLIDTETINEVVSTVHAKHPDVIFYGEGWDMETSVTKDGYTMATQKNSAQTPGFAYFSDTIRDLLKGSVFDAKSIGFISGQQGREDDVAKSFKATPGWTSNPTQIINYASCHDNYTLKDKLNVSREDASEADRIKMNNLAAAVYMMSEGIPLIHAGEELLRTKVDENGNIIHNSYNSSDYVNRIKWSDLDKADYRNVRDYYKGLIAFRQNHAALRLTSASVIEKNVKSYTLPDNAVMFVINGKEDIQNESSDGIIVIFNADPSEKEINLYDEAYGVAKGNWSICIDDQYAGTEALGYAEDGKVKVAPISAMVLVNDSDPVKSAKDSLNILIAECEKIEKGEYNDEAWNKFQEALAAAKETAGKENATAQELTNARNRLKEAYNSLLNLIDSDAAILEQSRKNLTDLIAECEKVEKEDYTAESWNRFWQMLTEAKDTAAKQDATIDDITNAWGRLNSAYGRLEKPQEGIRVEWAEDCGLTIYGKNREGHVTYNGKAYKPGVVVYDGARLLKEKQDYTVSYENNTNAGEAKVIIKGKGNYVNLRPKTFTIDKVNINGFAIPNLSKAVAANNTKQVSLKPVVKFNGKTLKKDKDYTAEYEHIDSDGKTLGIYNVIIKGVGNFTGQKTIQMVLADKDTQVLMSSVKVQKIPAQSYNGGKEVKPAVKVTYKGSELSSGIDYKVSYMNNTEAGVTASVIITGIGNKYVGEKTVDFKINGIPLKANAVSFVDVPKSGVPYTGMAIRPKVQVEGLEENQYRVTYQNNKKTGKATVVVTGINGYSGTVKKTFNITAYDINGSQFTFGNNRVITDQIPYMKSGSKLSNKSLNARFITESGMLCLEEGQDYTLSYKNNKAVGTATVTIKGKGNFKGTFSSTFEIVKQDIDQLSKNVMVSDVLAKNAAKYNKTTPVITDLDEKKLKNNKDFIVKEYTYADGSAVSGTPQTGKELRVTIEGAGNYTGTAYGYYRVIADDKNIAKAVVNVADQRYTGKAVKPDQSAVTTITLNGKALEPNEYEIIGWSNNIKKGTAKMTIHGLGEYGGTKTVRFKIIAKTFER
ncbi:MAG: type I pullulanase, partial [Lachnospiraceae bacterium]|nr:type I pullulanase [Lachnospiraceae bacterium]